MQGGAPIDAGVARFVLETLKDALPDTSQNISLSDREHEVLTLLAEGQSKKEISAQLGISEYTVVYHVKHIYEKLNAVNAPAAVSKAYQTGILPKTDKP